MIGKKMKRLCSLFIFLVVFLSFGTSGLAKSSISWGEIKQADYDTSIPGTPLLWSDPLSQGGMNLKTGTMTGGKDADVVFSSDGMQIGANEIADLGKVEFDRVNQTPAFGLAWLINAVPGNVYIIKCKDGTLAKLKIIRNSGSVVTFHYALEKLSDDQPGHPPSGDFDCI